MPTIKKLRDVTTESVHKATGRHWDEWIELLTKAGARSMSYQEITAFLRKRHRLGTWWQHWVAQGFEIAIGRRIEGQNAKGKYSMTVTKSLAWNAKETWKNLMDEAGVAAWLKPLFPVELKPGVIFETTDGFFGEFRTLQKGRRLRFTWQDQDTKTTVQLLIVARANGKSIVAFTHEGIPDARGKLKSRARWENALKDWLAVHPPDTGS